MRARSAGLVVVGIILVLAVAGLGFFLWPARLPDVATARAAMPPGGASIKRGEYLARAADCVACHTTSQEAAFAGGRAFTMPFGTIYSTNITPDRDTGIGKWSDAEFVRAVRQGVSRDGHELYPAFPYTSYIRMSTEDVLAIKDYLFSLTPVHASHPADTLAFPYDQRFLLRGWELLFLRSARAGSTALNPSQQRGAYLVEALGHCGECHTPRNLLFALDERRKFAGAVTAGWKAYNISSDKTAGLGGWSDEDLLNYLGKGFANGHGTASGSMAEAVSDSLRFLSRDDLQNMIAYLRTVPAQGGDVTPPPRTGQSSTVGTGGGPTQTGQLGARIFAGACAGCHDWTGAGSSVPQATLAGARTVADPAAVNLLQVILKGSQLQSGDDLLQMPAFSDYTDAELASLANYVLGHFGAKNGDVTPHMVRKAREVRE